MSSEHNPQLKTVRVPVLVRTYYELVLNVPAEMSMSQVYKLAHEGELDGELTETENSHREWDWEQPYNQKFDPKAPTYFDDCPSWLEDKTTCE